MGTRSNTLVIETGNGTPFVLVNIYRQFDSHPYCHGLELAKFLSNIKMVNGMGMETKNIANGAGCLAAQIVANLKKKPGGIYLDNPAGECNNDYTYKVYADTYNPQIPLRVVVIGFDEVVFDGDPKHFLKFCIQESQADSAVNTSSVY